VPPDDPPPLLPPPRIDYRAPGAADPRSQWLTDEHAYGAAMIYALVGLTVLGSVIAALWWLISHVLGLYFGW
jgi:hypothetical protein